VKNAEERCCKVAAAFKGSIWESFLEEVALLWVLEDMQIRLCDDGDL
jgi:hypothetical protein